ncbi:MAG: hypothetical protein ABWX65_11560 [Mycetocola sp.]
MTIRARALSALTLLVLLGAAGCAQTPAEPTASTPTPSPSMSASETPTPTPEPEPEPAAIVIAAEGISVRSADDDELAFFSYKEDAQLAIDGLTAAYGSEPTVIDHPGDQICDPKETRYEFDGLMLMVFDGEYRSPLVFGAYTETAVEGSALTVSTPHGAQIGTSFDALLAQVPEAPTSDENWEDEHWEFLVDGLEGTDQGDLPPGERQGARVRAIDDEIVDIYAPIMIDASC